MAVETRRKPVHTIGVLGVRDYHGQRYTNRTYIIRCLEQHLRYYQIGQDALKIVTGGAGGVEQIICDWAETKSIPVLRIPPNIEALGPKKAFVVRNNNVVTQSDELLLFWDGSMSMLNEAIMTAMQLHKRATSIPVI